MIISYFTSKFFDIKNEEVSDYFSIYDFKDLINDQNKHKEEFIYFLKSKKKIFKVFLFIIILYIIIFISIIIFFLSFIFILKYIFLLLKNKNFIFFNNKKKIIDHNPNIINLLYFLFNSIPDAIIYKKLYYILNFFNNKKKNKNFKKIISFFFLNTFLGSSLWKIAMSKFLTIEIWNILTNTKIKNKWFYIKYKIINLSKNKFNLSIDNIESYKIYKKYNKYFLKNFFNKIKNYENGNIYGLETLINGPEYRYIENILLIYKSNKILIYFKNNEKELFLKILKYIIYICFFIKDFDFIKIKKKKEIILNNEIIEKETNITCKENEINFEKKNIIKEFENDITIDETKNLEFIQKKIENILIDDLNIITIITDSKTFNFLNTILMVYAENEEEELIKTEIQLKYWDI